MNQSVKITADRGARKIISADRKVALVTPNTAKIGTTGPVVAVTQPKRDAKIEIKAVRGQAQISVVGSIPPGGGDYTYQTDEFVLTQLQKDQKRVTLSTTPVDTGKVEFSPYGGVEQRPGVDFFVTGDILSWDGLALELLLDVGSAFSVRYQKVR